MIRKVEFKLRKSRVDEGYGTVFCVMRPDSYHKTWFSLGIVVTEKEWDNYVNVNYYYQTRMPTLGILYYKFSDYIDKIHETVKASELHDAKRNVQKLMMRMCTLCL